MTNPALPIIYIKAVNPGYTVDGKTNVGEMIELVRNDDSDAPLSLAGLKIGYTNSSGNSVDLHEFPDNSWLTGEGLLLHFSGNEMPAHLSYLKTLAFKAGPLTLTLNGEVIDSVCWTGKDECQEAFSSTHPTTLVRNVEANVFSHLENYEPTFRADAYYETPVPDETPPRQCERLEFSEILSYFESSANEQFIEIFNPTAEQVLLNGCQIKYKNNLLKLEGIIGPEKYQAIYPTDWHFTKNPTTENQVELIDVDGSLVDTLIYRNNQKKAASLAKFGVDKNGEALWRSTYSQTPGDENIYTEFPPCPDGKVLNENTGNCVKITTLPAAKTCPAGSYLNPETGRCKKYVTKVETTCAEGYFKNPLTGRCKKIVVNDGASFPVNQEEEFQVTTTFTAAYALIAVILVGVAYAVFQFRHRLKRLFDKVFRSFRRKRRP
ncbi:hypothetical protein J6S46_03515 [Candidatus Saccharibacteria bacterium]|nr:hypothetical protein [Candidatus Saccharibacteria bacterium]